MAHPRHADRTYGLLALAAITFAVLQAGCNSNIDPVSLQSDFIPPRVSETTPVDDSVEVGIQSMITITFSEAMDAATVHLATFQVTAAGEPIPGIVIGLGRHFTFDPDDVLPEGLIEIALDGAADLAGNRIASPYHFSFYTILPPPPPRPSNPNPPSGAVDIPINVTCTWEGGDSPDVTFDFALGTSPTNLSILAQDLATESFQLGPLPNATEHFWQITARAPGGETVGPLWRFTTQALPNDPPTAPAPPITPPDEGIAAGIDVDLSWSGGDDPDGDPVTYEVRFGTDDPPPFMIDVAVKAHRIEGLAFDTRYYWQIVAKDTRNHEVPGPVWRFDTPEAPNQAPDAPCNPQPSHDAEDLPTALTLAWGCGDDPDGDPVEYAVFLERNDTSPDQHIATVSEKSHSVSDLVGNATYYWRIEARDGQGGVTSGPVWRFTTAEANRPPSAPRDPVPPSGALNVSTPVRLQWAGGQDPDGDEVVYDVYLGNTPDPPLIDTTTMRRYDANVEALRLYFWRIVARDEHDAESAGPLWNFTTGLGIPR